MISVPCLPSTWPAAFEPKLAVPVRRSSGCSSIAEVPTTSPRPTESSTHGRFDAAGIPAADLWWLKSRALLAKAEGNSQGYPELAKQYLALCEKLDARGRFAEARQMIDSGAPGG